jgi:hypothetical protein
MHRNQERRALHCSLLLLFTTADSLFVTTALYYSTGDDFEPLDRAGADFQPL